MTTKHTPGPWEAHRDGKRAWKINSVDYGFITLVHDPHANDSARQQQLKATARLIAEAPAMAEAIRDALRWFTEEPPHRLAVDVANELRAILARIDGEGE